MANNVQEAHRRMHHLSKYNNFSYSTMMILFLLLATAASTIKVVKGDMILSTKEQICGATLDGDMQYIINTMGGGDTIICDGDGPTLVGTSKLNCQNNIIQGVASSSSSSSGTGISLFDSSIAENCIVTNFDIGVDFVDDGSGSETSRSLVNSEANENLVHGVVVSGNGANRLEGVTVMDNVYYGIFVSTMSGDTTLQSVTSERNSQGLRVHRDVSGFVETIDCHFRYNKFHGIYTQSKSDMTVSGGKLELNGRHGILAPRYGAIGLLKLLSIEIIENTRFGIAVSGTQNVQVEGMMIDGNGRGGIYARNVIPAVTCSYLFDTLVGSISKTNVCEVKDDIIGCVANLTPCGDTYPLIDLPILLTSPEAICQQELTEPKEYIIDSSKIDVIECPTTNGPSLSGGATLNCLGVTITTVQGRANSKGIVVDDGTVTNCVVTNFWFNIRIEGNALSNIVTNSEAYFGRFGVHQLSGNAYLDNVVCNENDTDGISLNGAGDKTILNSEAHYNGRYGIGSGGNAIVKDCIATNNLTGNKFASGGTIHFENGRVEGGARGFNIGGAGAQVRISNYIITNHTLHGIDQSGTDITSEIEGTIIKQSTMDGVWVAGGGSPKIIIRCSEITANDRMGINIQQGSATITNALIHSNGVYNLVDGDRGENFLTNVYVCNGGTHDIVHTGDGSYTNVACDTLVNICDLSCNNVGIFDISTECAQYPLIG